MLSSVEQAFVGKDERRAPLKTPAWKAITARELRELSNFAFCRQRERRTTNFSFSFWIFQSLSMKRTLIEDVITQEEGLLIFPGFGTLTRCFMGNAKVDNSGIKVISPMRASISGLAQVVMHFLHHAFLFDWPILGWCGLVEGATSRLFAVTVNKTV